MVEKIVTKDEIVTMEEGRQFQASFRHMGVTDGELIEPFNLPLDLIEVLRGYLPKSEWAIARSVCTVWSFF